MATTKSFLTEPYSGYHNDIPDNNLELTAVERGSKMGELLRRYWQPVALAEEIGETPLAVRMFGEDLVLLRTKKGELGLMDRHCPHRGTSLEYGLPTDEGVRCCYHGWHLAVDGRILETPGDPPISTLKDKLCHAAYPVKEYRGLVFGYFGPPEEIPEFPVYDSYDIPGDKLVSYCITYPCNWLQVHENVMDPAHAVFLHTRVTFSHFTDAWGLLPEMEFRETPTGMIYITTRRTEDGVWVRSNDIIMPNLAQVGYVLEGGDRLKEFGRVGITRWTTPIDNETCRIIGWRHFHPDVNPDGLHNEADCGIEKVDFFGQSGDRPYTERQRLPGDFDAQVSQRPIANHNLEHLTVCDKGVMMLRRLLRKELRKIESGERPNVSSVKSNGAIPTYCHDTVMDICKPGSGDDNELLLRIGREVSDLIVDGDYQSAQDRPEQIRKRILRYVDDLNAEINPK
jgi:nitrite reductase/ring-hydroxylating ferredoxin subunit